MKVALSFLWLILVAVGLFAFGCHIMGFWLLVKGLANMALFIIGFSGTVYAINEIVEWFDKKNRY